MPATLITSTKFHSTLASGQDNAGGKVFTYAAGTTTPQATYTSAAMNTPNSNPITLDGTGRASVWLDPSLSYKFVIQDAGGAATPDGTVDNVVAATGQSVSEALAVATNAAKGAALVGYGASIEYPAGTVGGELRTIQSQVSHLWRRIRTNQSDVNIIVLGDSTGNATDEWVYLMAQWLAAECPTHTVKYRLFSLGTIVPSGGTDTWGSYTTIQTGSGPMPPDAVTNTIFIDNASVSGTNTNYVEGGREGTIWTGTDYDLVIFNYGHNTGTDTTEEIAQPEFMTAVCNARLHAPRAGVLVTLQNFRTSLSGKAQSYRMWNAWRNVASQLQAGVIDVGTAFASVPDVSIYMADETHPNALGQSALWLPQVQRTMAEPRNYTGEDPGSLSPFSIVKPCYTSNPRFSYWASTNPDNWTFTSCTTAKDTGKTEGTAYSLRITNTAGLNPQITQDLSGQLVRLRGRVVTVVARVWRTSGLNLLAGRVGLTASNGVTSVSATSYPRSVESAGGWEWSQISICVPNDANSLTLVAYTGAADGSDNGEQIWFDSIGVFESSQPGAVSLDDVWRKTVADYYSDGNVGLVPSTTAGSVTASSGTITLTGATSPNSGVYVNLPGLAPGKTYKVSFTPVSATGGVGAGGVYCRNGYNGGSTEFSKASGTGDWTAGGGAVSFTFVAPPGAVSLWVYGFTGVTAWQHSGWSITETLAGGTGQLPQNSKSANYTLVASDAGKHLLHPSADTTARTFTIPANSAVDWPVGTVVTFVNQASAGVLSIAINSDTMRLSPGGTTGTRSLAANGVATAIKLTATEWIIYGSGLT